VKVVNSEQLANAEELMVWTAGIETLVKSEQDENANSPMVWTAGTETFVKSEQEENAILPILVIVYATTVPLEVLVIVDRVKLPDLIRGQNTILAVLAVNF